MAQKGSMQFVPPPISHLLKFPIKDDINIEEGLCTPENEDLFLISSIAFLQKQLLKKLETQDSDMSEHMFDRKYSDLLIVESGQKYMRQKRFIRLPNIEKFDEVLRNEACLPQNVLSNTQLLPLPKKSKSPKLIMSNIFKPKSSLSIPSLTTKKSMSVFNIFKKNCSSSTMPEIEVEKPVSSYVEFDTERIIVITENERRCEDQFSSMRSSSSNSLAKTTSTMTVNENGDSDSTLGSSIVTKTRTLSEAEEEILRIIPRESNLAIKKSINEKLRCSRKSTAALTEDEDSCSSEVSLVKKEDDFYEDPETGIKFKCMPINPMKPRRLKEQQSKLSVCIEEETESELDYGQETRKYPFNCTDDVKALVSSEAIDLIINEVWQKLDSDSN